MKKARLGFTLVELLVVIGIIALLISILLPSLNRARESARTIKCSSNLRSIGQGIEIYKSENKGFFPAAYTYVGKDQRNTGARPNAGYIHWTSYLYGKKSKNDSDTSIFRTTAGWDAFVCPSMANGGLPPTNTYAENLVSGISNDAAGVIDQQAPRLSYTVNEAVMPRNKFIIDADKNGNPDRVCHFVNTSVVKNSGNVVLATEFNPNEKIVTAPGDVSDSPVIKSHRPVHAFLGTGNGATGDIHRSTVSLAPPGIRRNYAGMTAGRCEDFPADENRLNWIGRVHGGGKTGGPSNQDQRRTNFLYVDGHVDTKRLGETIYPTWQWGDAFYSVSPNSDMKKNDVPTPAEIATF